MNDFDEKDKNQDSNQTQDEKKESLDSSDKKKKIELSDEDLEDLVEQMQKLVEQVSDEYGVDPDNVKVMPIPKPKFTFLSILLSSLIVFAFDFVLFIAFSSVLNWSIWSHIKYLIFFALYFAGVETLLKLASIPLFKIKTKFIFFYPIIKIVPFIITAIACAIWPIFITIESYFFYVLICVLTYAIRKFYTTYFLEKQMKKIMAKHPLKKHLNEIKGNKDKED